MSIEIVRRFRDGKWETVAVEEGGGGSLPNVSTGYYSAIPFSVGVDDYVDAIWESGGPPFVDVLDTTTNDRPTSLADGLYLFTVGLQMNDAIVPGKSACMFFTMNFGENTQILPSCVIDLGLPVDGENSPAAFISAAAFLSAGAAMRLQVHHDHDAPLSFTWWANVQYTATTAITG